MTVVTAVLSTVSFALVWPWAWAISAGRALWGLWLQLEDPHRGPCWVAPKDRDPGLGQTFSTQSLSLNLTLTPTLTPTLVLTLARPPSLAPTLTLATTLSPALTLPAKRTLTSIPHTTLPSTSPGVEPAPGAGGGKQPLARRGEKKKTSKHPVALRAPRVGEEAGRISGARMNVCVCVCVRMGERVGVCACV